MPRPAFLSFLSACLTGTREAGEPVPGALLALLRQREKVGARLDEPPAWFAASVLARLRREEGERAARRRAWRRRVRLWVPSGVAALVLVTLGIEAHFRQLSEQDRVTFAALDAIAKGEIRSTDEALSPVSVEEASWPAR